MFPYDWFDDWRKFSQTTLPTKEEFYNFLTQSALSDSEYQFAQTMWAEQKCATFRDYLELYLKMDVFLLAHVFEACLLYTSPSPRD